MSKTYDMTEGSPMKHLAMFAVPMLVGNLFQQFYNLADSAIVGKFVSADALGSIGATGSLTFLLFSLCIGLASGAGIIVSQYFGAREYENVKKTIANAIYVLMFCTIIMTVVGYFCSRPILILLDTPDTMLEDAVIYMKTMCIGSFAIAGYNGVSYILRALGDSKTPLVFLVIACVLNIILDFWFVVGFDAGVFGAALATVIAQALSVVGCIFYAWKKIDLFRLSRENMIIDRKLCGKCIKIGVPMAFQSSMISVSCLALQRVVNGFGNDVVNAFTITGRVEQLVQQPFNSLGIALATFTGQNIGAGRTDRVRKGFRSAMIMNVVFSLMMLLVMHLFGEYIVGIFVSEENVIELGGKALKITSSFFFFLGMIYIARNVLNGAGDTMFAMVNGCVEVAGRVGFAIPLTSIPVIGKWGVWLTTGLTWFVTGIICWLRYLQGKWKGKSVVGK